MPFATDTPAGSALFIVMSCYNGGRFVEEQIASIQKQTRTDWTLLVRDDGSADNTVAVVDAMAARDSRIVRLSDGRGQLGPAASFGTVLEHAFAAGARYVALADQDDVWHRDKLEREIELLETREAVIGPDVPLLVHSDLTVVGEDLMVIHPSFLRFQGLLHVEDVPVRKLLVQNFVTGCTTVLNRALLQWALPFPAVLMHDWWLALCASALGEILFLPDATLLYRQHAANAVGARGFRRACQECISRPLQWWDRSWVLFGAALAQAHELAHRVELAGRGGAALPPAARLVREYSEAYRGSGAWGRVRTIRRHRILPRSLAPFNLVYFARVLLWSLPANQALRGWDHTHLRGQV